MPVLEADPLELEEEELVLDLRAALLDALEQRAVARLARVGREEQARVGPGARDRLLEGLELVDGRGELGAGVERRDAPAVALAERPSHARVRSSRSDSMRGVVHGRGVEIGEVPGGRRRRARRRRRRLRSSCPPGPSGWCGGIGGYRGTMGRHDVAVRRAGSASCCTRTWTPSTRPSSSATTPSFAASP